MSDFVTIFVEGLLVQVVANAYISTDHKVHFEDLFFFVVDDVLAGVFGQLSRLQTEGNIVKELAVAVLLGVEEVSEVVENVVEKIVDYDSSLDGPRKSCDEFVVFLDLSEAVVGPIVLEVVVDLVVKTVGQGFVLSEAGQQCNPVVQLKGLVFRTEVSIEVGNNLDETSHNK